MSQYPEDLIQALMHMTGMSRKEAENSLAKSMSEMTSGPIFSGRSSKKKGKSLKGYDEDNYPHFLPSPQVKKCTVRVSLKGLSPVIWRKFECPSNISLRHLTELVIELMGWQNEHLNQITTGGDLRYVPYYQHNSDAGWGEVRYQEENMLADILRKKGETVAWEYDFGDSWRHEIRLSSIEEYKTSDARGIVFKSGRRACPPEDCGGIWGYQELLELHERLKARSRLDAEDRERLEWYDMGRDFDPEYIDEDECRFICDRFSEWEEETPVETKKVNAVVPKGNGLVDDVMSLAFRIRGLEPWEELNDSDVYAVRMRDGSQMYVVTMGYGGESFDVQLYDGPGSFQLYLTLAKADTLPSFEVLEAQNWADYYTIMYLDPEDGVAALEQYTYVGQWAEAHGVKIEPEHGYPVPQHFRPHRHPSMMLSDEQGLARVKEALEAVEWFCRQILDTDDLATLGFSATNRVYATDRGGKTIPLIVRTEGSYKVERTELPGRIGDFESTALPESELQVLCSLPKKGAEFCRIIHMPGFIGSKSDLENAYSALVFLSVDKKSGELAVSEPCEFSDTYEQDVLRQYVKMVKSNGFLPQRIITDDYHTGAMLGDFCRSLGIILELKRTRIPQLTDVCRHLYGMW